MSLTSKHLLGLIVETKSGQPLGKVQDFCVDPLSQCITQYTVKHGNLLGFGQELLIASSQVISISQEHMIVDDLAVPQKSPTTSEVPTSI